MKRLKRKIANFLMRKLWNAVNEDMVFQIKKRNGNTVIIFDDKELTNQQLMQLRQEARLFINSPLYAMLDNHMKGVINKSMYLNSKVDADILFGKAGLWWNDVYKRVLENISNVD